MELCRVKGFDACSSPCGDGVDSELGLTRALPAPLVASAGIPYVDKNDIRDPAGELMLKYVSGQQAMFLEGRPRIEEVSAVLLKGMAHRSRTRCGRTTLASWPSATFMPDASVRGDYDGKPLH